MEKHLISVGCMFLARCLHTHRRYVFNLIQLGTNLPQGSKTWSGRELVMTPTLVRQLIPRNAVGNGGKIKQETA